MAIANALEVDCNTLLGETLSGAREAILRAELAGLLESTAGDENKLNLRIEMCRLLDKYGQ